MAGFGNKSDTGEWAVDASKLKESVTKEELYEILDKQILINAMLNTAIRKLIQGDAEGAQQELESAYMLTAKHSVLADELLLVRKDGPDDAA